MPVISVVVPVYNVETYLRRCVDSILNQTFTDFELILVDDGSPDNCGAICDEYAEKDYRVIVIHKENGGLSDARNAGIDWTFEHSNSEWITFVDSDDWVHFQYLEILYNEVNRNGVIVGISRLKRMTETQIDDLTNEIDLDIKIETAEEHYSNEIVHACGKLYKRFLYKNIRYPVGKLCEDAFVTYLLLFNVEKYVVINYPLYYYFANNPNSIMNTWNIKKLNEFEAYEQQLKFFAKNGYHFVKSKALENYFYRIYLVSEILYKSLRGKDKKKCKRQVLKRIRRVLILYVSKKERKKYKYYYELAFPLLTKLVHKLKKIFKTL